jgi:hypothetical protein
MSYRIHIERLDSASGTRAPTTLEEWLQVVAATSGTRLALGDAISRNPLTLEEVRNPNPGGDVEVFFPKQA